MKYKMPILLAIASALLFLQVATSDDLSLWVGKWGGNAWGCITLELKDGKIVGTYSGDPNGKIKDGTLDADGNLVGRWSCSCPSKGGNLKLNWEDKGTTFQGFYDHSNKADDSGYLDHSFPTTEKDKC
jgi:hypothetical protein